MHHLLRGLLLTAYCSLLTAVAHGQAFRQSDRLSLLQDVDIASLTTGRPLVYDGSKWVNTTLGWSALAGTPTTLSGYGITDAQPLSSTLTSLAPLATTSFGRSLLTQADAAATRATIGAGTSSFDGAFASLSGTPTTLSGYGITDAQPLDSDLTSIAALTTTSFGRSLLTQADAAATRATIGAGTSSFGGAFSALTGIPTTLSGYGITDAAALSHTHSFASLTSKPTTLSGYGITDAQPLDSDLTSIAALTTTSFGRSLLTQADATATRATIGAGTSSFDGAFASLSGKPTTLAGYGITDGGGGAAIHSASGVLTKIVTTPATPAVYTVVILRSAESGTLSTGAATLTISGTAQTITYGFSGTENVQIGTEDPDTLAVTSYYDTGTIAVNLAGYINSQSWGVSAAVGSAPDSVIITTSATGIAATLDFNGTIKDTISSDGVIHGADAGNTGTRQVTLAASATGKGHRLLSASYGLAGADAWAVADIQIGYWDGASFSPVRKIPLASLTGSALGDVGGLEALSNLITPVVGASLVARTASGGAAADETTGSDATIYVTFSTE